MLVVPLVRVIHDVGMYQNQKTITAAFHKIKFRLETGASKTLAEDQLIPLSNGRLIPFWHLATSPFLPMATIGTILSQVLSHPPAF